MSLLPEVSVFVFAGVLRWLVGGLKVRSNLYLAGISLLKAASYLLEKSLPAIMAVLGQMFALKPRFHWWLALIS